MSKHTSIHRYLQITMVKMEFVELAFQVVLTPYVVLAPHVVLAPS